MDAKSQLYPPYRPNVASKNRCIPVSLKHDGTDGTVKAVNTDGTAIERADGTANTGANYQIITY